jgi:hypothetical protein
MPSTNKNNSPAKGKKKQAEPSLPLEVHLRRTYYQDGAGFMGKVAVASLTCLALVIGISFYSVNKKAENKYIAVHPDGSIISLTPLNMPNHSESSVRSWLVEALVNTFEFNYIDYKARLNDSISDYFTESGGSELVKSLQDIELMSTIKDKKLLVSMNITTSPVLLGLGYTPSGAYAWKFQTKGLITLRNERQEFSVPVVMEITISRRDLLTNPKGLGIARVFMEKDRSANQ